MPDVHTAPRLDGYGLVQYLVLLSIYYSISTLHSLYSTITVYRAREE